LENVWLLQRGALKGNVVASNAWKNEGDFFPESEAINNFAEAK